MRALVGRGQAVGLPLHLRLALPLPLLLLLAACAPETPPGRHQRYGIFQNLVLFQRHHDAGGPFFLDRFETTRRDWRSWLAAQGRAPAAGVDSDSADDRLRDRHPITGISMIAARRFAAWRFCRLQRLDEWEHARTGGGRYNYPWGGKWRGSWCNTRDLGLDRTTPVGTFPASNDGAGACDLIGNVREWTETVPVPPLYHSVDPETNLPNPPVVHYMPGETEARQCFGLAAWQPPWLPLPTVWMVEAAPTILPRLVVGGHYGREIPLRNRDREPPFPTVGWWRDRDRRGSRYDPMPAPVVRYPEEYGDLTGLRVAQDPESLLVALLREPVAASAGEASVLRWFLTKPGHLQVLRDAWPRARRKVAEAGPLRPLLAAELGR